MQGALNFFEKLCMREGLSVDSLKVGTFGAIYQETKLFGMGEPYL